jgi:MerR family transcriptional regulator, heat shock protein HspR
MPSLPLDDENRPIFTVGQVSDMLEIQQAFLRRLDQLGVVSPSRSAGRQRRYTRREITVVRYVVDLVDEGMTLAAIRRVLELEEHVRALEARIRELEAERDALRAAVDEREAQLTGTRPSAADTSPHAPH